MPYILLLAMQVFCIVHIVKNKNEYWWIFVIFFLPFFGCCIYIFMKVLNQEKIGTEITAVQSDLTQILNPRGKINELEKQLEFSPTFVNKIALGDAYLVAKEYDKAIDVYETALGGNHEDDPHLNKQLINAYYHKKDYEKVISTAKKIESQKEFKNSNSKVLYALALESNNDIESAEQILQSMNGLYSDMEPRIVFAQFLIRQNKVEDAKKIYTEIVDEANHMESFELKNKRQWIQTAKQALKKLD